MTRFHCVCVDGSQVGDPVDTVDEAERAMSLLAIDGVSGRSMTVETYEDRGDDRPPVASTPFYANGRWHERYALPKAA